MTTAPCTLPNGSTLILDDDRWGAIARSLPPARPTPPVRLAYAAAHVVMHESYAGVPHTPDAPSSADEIAAHIDWDATIGFRRHLDSRGLGIAEAMDTAQRYEIGWPVARELIRRCALLAPAAGFIAGAGTDQLGAIRGPGDLVAAATEQCAFIRECAGWPMLLAMPWLSINRCTPDQYVDVYTRIIRAAEGPIFIHWLGPMFLESLRGYFPSDSFERIMAFDPSKVRGVKLSLLDGDLEIGLRRELLRRDQIVLTGDDFHFASLIAGEGPASSDREMLVDGRAVPLGDFSHALLGAFAAFAAPAALALRCLGAGKLDDYHAIMGPCEELARKLFEPPTRHYKAGVAFLSWLNGFQSNPMLPNRQERSRSREHYLDLARLAAAAGAISNARIAAPRLQSLC